MNVGTYLKIHEVQKSSRSETQKAYELVNIINGVKPSELRKLPFSKVDKILADVNAEIAAVKPAELKDTYTIDGIECRLMRTINQMTAIQFSAVIEVIKLYRDDLPHLLPTIVSLFLVPVGTIYPDYNRHELEEKIVEHFDICDALAIMGFMKGLSLVSTGDIEISLVLSITKSWTTVPRWRRALARWIIRILLFPIRLEENGDLLSGSTKLPNSSDAHGEKPKD